MLVSLMITSCAADDGLKQSEINHPLEAKCRSLDGIYFYYHETGDANKFRLQEVGFNSAIRKPSVYGDIQGINVSLADDGLYLSIKILGSGLRSALDISMLEQVVSYNLPVTCEGGKWVYQTHISGSSEGTPVRSDEIFYFYADSGGALIVRNQSKGSARLGGIVPKHWEGEKTYKFRRK